MDNEEKVFDVMAAAEQSAEHLNFMIRQIPTHIQTALADEWKKSPWLLELPKAEARMGKAVDEALEAVELLNRTIHWAAIWIAVVTVLLPVIISAMKELNIITFS